MNRRVKFILLILFLLAYKFNISYATPSTIIWIPSTDIQGIASWHLGIDNYFSVFKKGVGNGGVGFPTDVGLTVGVLQSQLISFEAGVDLLEPSDSPWLLNFKAGTPEESFFSGSPAIAVGIMNLGFEKNVTDANIIYCAASKNINVYGRVTCGLFTGNPNVMVNGTSKENNGFIVAWDKQITEISPKLWLAIDYMSGKSQMGALSIGGSWSFTDDVSLLVGYNIFNNNSPSTITTQLDINL